MKIKQIPSPNFWKGHRKRIAVVLHTSGGTLKSMDSWFSNKDSQVSAHYGIGLNGEIHQYVQEKDSSWAVGVIIKPTWKILIKGINPNLDTISVEHAIYKTNPWTEKMKESSARLTRAICKRNKIPITRENIISHYEIDNQKPNITLQVDDIFKRVTRNILITLLMQLVKLLKELLLKKVDKSV